MDPPGDRFGGQPARHQREELGVFRALDAVRPTRDRCGLIGQETYARHDRGTVLPFFWHQRRVQEQERAATSGFRPYERVYCVVIHALRYLIGKKGVTAVTWK